jgi:CDP-diacylglycerol--glycerol-3-phosphate 3-phosphatidyltransferase
LKSFLGDEMLLNIPNLLSIFRIIAAPFLLLVAYLEMPTIFFILFGLMLLSDALDGIIARALNQTSELGARLDSYGDILTYLSIPLAVWWLWPEIVKEEMPYIAVAIGLFILPAFFSLAKFGKLASYHTWVTKVSAVLMSVGVVLLIVFKSSLLFHIAVVFLAIVSVENIAITLILVKQKTDIYSIWHAWKNRD